MILIRRLSLASLSFVILTGMAQAQAGSQRLFLPSVLKNPEAVGVTHVVATTGSDAGPGNLAQPWRTIQHAVDVAQPGDVIAVRAGTYVEDVLIQNPGTANAWITLRGYGVERPVLRSTGGSPTVYFYHDDCDEGVIGSGSGNTDCHAFYWELRGLEIQGSPTGDYAVKIDTPRVRLIENRLCCTVADVVKLVRTANDVEILNNEIWQNPGIVTPGANAQGIDIVGADRVRVAGNTLHDVPDIGIYAKGNARNALFEDNRLINIGNAVNGHALMLGQSTDAERLVDGPYESYDGLVRNNVVVGSTWACLATASSYNARFYNNSCYDTGQLVHGSILLSNESEIGQTGAYITFINNIVYGSSAKPVLKIASDALADYSTLVIDRNLYYVTGGTPQFSASDFFTAVGFMQWSTNYTGLSGRVDGSLVADPLYATLTGATPLTLSTHSPAANVGRVLALVPTDRLGIPRPQGVGVDLGAYERP